MTLVSGDTFYLRGGDAKISHAVRAERRNQARTMRARILSRLINPVGALGAQLSRQPGRATSHAEFVAISARTLDDIGVGRSTLAGVVGTIENEQNARPIIDSGRKARADRRDLSANRRGPARARVGRRIQFRVERRNEHALGRSARSVIVRVD